MTVRMAEKKDIPVIRELLLQVAQVHHEGRPDIFKSGGYKYSDEEVAEIMQDKTTPILVAVDEEDQVKGYAFCIFKQFLDNTVMTDVKTLYIDDLCVYENCRGQHIGKTLYDAVLAYAKEHDCYNVTLNVWSCNESAMRFYEKCGLKPQKVGMEVIL